MKVLSTCPICQSTAIKFAYDGITNRRPAEGKVWKVFQCEGCGHGLLNPQPSWDELASYYTEDYDPYETSHGSEAQADDAAVAKAEREGFLRHVPIPRGKRLLDVGCGAGWFLRIAKRLGATVKGVEPSSTGSRRAQASGLDVFHGTLEDYVATAGQDHFDIITANHVIEHAPDPVATLTAMRQLLRPGGMIWISAPNASCYFSQKLGRNWHSTDLPYHLQQFSPKSLAIAGSRAGLAVKRQYTYSLPAATGASLRQYWRTRFYVPQRLTMRIGLIERRYVPWLAARLDAKSSGEAVITEFAA